MPKMLAEYARHNPVPKRQIPKPGPNAVSKAPIQRLVGFELELSWPTRRPKMGMEDEALADPGGEEYTIPLKKKDLLFTGDDFEVQADETSDGKSDFEVVTEPFAEDATGLERLRTASRKIVDFFHEIETLSKENPNPFMGFSPLAKHGMTLMHEAIFKPRFPFNITPQMTAGIRLSELPDFYRDAFPTSKDPFTRYGRRAFGRRALSKSHLHEFPYEHHHRSNVFNGDIPDKVEEGRKKFMAKHPDLPSWSMSPNMRGLLCMIVHYLKAASKPHLSYPKSAFNFLARTDFAEMFKVLPLKERVYFGPKHIIRWLRLIQSCYPYLSWKAPLFTHGVYSDGPKESQHILDGLTVQAWLENIPKGVDLLTRWNFPTHEHAHHLESMGEYASRTDEGGGTNTTRAPIFEVRGMDILTSPDNLPRWMENGWKMIYALNKRLDLKYGEPFEIDEAKLDVFCAKPPPFRP
ncbi:hypothetical protein FUAX_39250 (plasmid) [Fulvitalea axinellae]|uniref:Uncharacterized protein n=1 Tax=Fulvitalea axinellae TaxID=1182444 RepID=A0AAU9CTU4_9BACT|nr:hypothetical protein FUAX_39250 [Fulvitalea axinellae]